MKFEFYQQIFEKYSNIKFHENPSSGIRVVAGGYTERQTRKLLVAFQNFAKAPKKEYVHVHVSTTDDIDLKIYG
jgi:hypothetical protein